MDDSISNTSLKSTSTKEIDVESSPVARESYLAKKSRIRISDLLEAKLRKDKWAMLTSYDAISARIFDHAKIPCLLVGDSAAQTVYGYKSTIPISVDELIPLARAVSSSCQRALVVGDLPFGSYQESPELALRTANRFMKEALVHAIKLEGGREYERHVRLLTQSGIPVMVHIGFTPQSEHALGGYKIQGKNEKEAQRLLEDAKILQQAGAFACVLEMVPSEVGKLVTNALDIPTVGIGAGPHCDAQILVWHDMAGFTAPRGQASGYLVDGSDSAASSSTKQDVSGAATLELNRVPKFVKRYANLSEVLYKAVLSYADDVSSGLYPAAEHCYK